MSWIERLYETYERCAEAPQFAHIPLNPVGSMYQTTHIVIRIDDRGNFLGAEFAPLERTLIPVTEASSGRSSNVEPHPFTDKLSYCAGDFHEWSGGSSDFDSYYQLLSSWCD